MEHAGQGTTPGAQHISNAAHCCTSTQSAAPTTSLPGTCLTCLPEALLAAIASNLDPYSLAALSTTNPTLRSLIKANDTIWRAQCQRLLGAATSTPAAWGAVSWRHLYLGLLHSHGWMLGLWASQATPHGGLMLVRTEAPCIAAYSVLATRLNGPVWLRRVFEVHLRTGAKRGTECLCAYHTGSRAGGAPHAASVQRGRGTAFAFSCSKGCQHDLLDMTLRRTAGHMPSGALVLLTPHSTVDTAADALEVHSSYHHVQFMHFLAEQSQALLDGSMAETASSKRPMVYTRLPHTPPDITCLLADAAEVAFAGSTVPRGLGSIGCSSSSSSSGRGGGVRPLPGLWRGTYGAHGIELLQLEERGNCMVATKVTGDSNVPSGRVSFVIFTGAPHATAQAPGLPYMPPPSYTSAVDFTAGGDGSKPSFLARAHYPASGHAAGRGYSEPTWVCNEVYVSNERCFGMLWHIIHSFALFTRIDDIHT